MIPCMMTSTVDARLVEHPPLGFKLDRVGDLLNLIGMHIEVVTREGDTHRGVVRDLSDTARHIVLVDAQQNPGVDALVGRSRISVPVADIAIIQILDRGAPPRGLADASSNNTSDHDPYRPAGHSNGVVGCTETPMCSSVDSSGKCTQGAPEPRSPSITDHRKLQQSSQPPSWSSDRVSNTCEDGSPVAHKQTRIAGSVLGIGCKLLYLLPAGVCAGVTWWVWQMLPCGRYPAILIWLPGLLAAWPLLVAVQAILGDD